MHKIILFFFIYLFSFSIAGNVEAQSPLGHNSSLTTEGDTSLNTFIGKIEYYTAAFNRMNSVLSKGFDTLAITKELPTTELVINYIQKGTSVKDKSNSLRSLYSARDILTRQEDKLNQWQETLSGYNDKLVQIQNTLIKVKQDPYLKNAPADSILRTEYQDQMAVLNARWKKIDAINKHTMQQIGVLQSMVVESYVQVTSYKEQINIELRDFGIRALSKEYPYLWESSKGYYAKSFKEAVDRTITSNAQLLNYFFSSNWNIHLFGLLLFFVFYSWIMFTTKRIKQRKTDSGNILKQAHYIPQKPLLSSLLITCFITFFIYDHPPVVFMEIIMLILIVATGILVKQIWPKQLFRFWLAILVLTLFAGLSNLFILISYLDRILIFILALLGAYAGWRFLKIVKNSRELYPNRTSIYLRIFIIVQLVSVVCNLLGRFSLAKIFLITSLFGLWQAMSLVIFVRVVMEAVFLQMEASKENSTIPTYFDFALLQQRFKNILNIISIIFWLILFAGNLNVLDTVYDFTSNLLMQPRKIGGNEFTFGSIAVFIIVVWVSSIVSKAVSYFFEFADYHSTSKTQKNKLSSSILLIKLAIFSVGFLLAITASGIPMEKITIILGALSVGIGFGLQTIVNNLVSGIILAVEKPVEVGDVIEIGTRSGVVKEMGIRASKIATGDGSEVIVPNGDLLSQHLVNWTLSNKHRRVELIIGVAYGTDLKIVKTLLKDIVANREDIMREPEALVLVHHLNDSSVDFRILFWVDNIGNWVNLKSQVLSDIYEVFYREGISLPFPQSDVYLHYPDKPANSADRPASGKPEGGPENKLL